MGKEGNIWKRTQNYTVARLLLYFKAKFYSGLKYSHETSLVFQLQGENSACKWWTFCHQHIICNIGGFVLFFWHHVVKGPSGRLLGP